MISSIYAKLIGFALLAAALSGAGFWVHHSGYESGKAAVQAQWNVEKLAQSAAIVMAKDAANAKYDVQQTTFSALGAKYEAKIHAQAPAVADSVAAGVSDGTLRLRVESSVCPSRGDITPATARARVADAAATQALADRVANSIAAVRAGDAADARERQLDAQVIGLQGVLTTERVH